MGDIRKHHDPHFKAKVAAEAIAGTKTLAELSSIHGVQATEISRWKKQGLDGLIAIFGKGADKINKKMRDTIKEQQMLIGKLTLQLELKNKR
jgi:transposase-like protein